MTQSHLTPNIHLIYNPETKLYEASSENYPELLVTDEDSQQCLNLFLNFVHEETYHDYNDIQSALGNVRYTSKFPYILSAKLEYINHGIYESQSIAAVRIKPYANSSFQELYLRISKRNNEPVLFLELDYETLTLETNNKYTLHFYPRDLIDDLIDKIVISIEKTKSIDSIVEELMEKIMLVEKHLQKETSLLINSTHEVTDYS